MNVCNLANLFSERDKSFSFTRLFLAMEIPI